MRCRDVVLIGVLAGIVFVAACSSPLVIAGRFEVEDALRVPCTIGLYTGDGAQLLAEETVVSGDRFELPITWLVGPAQRAQSSYYALLNCGRRYHLRQFGFDESHSWTGVAEFGDVRFELFGSGNDAVAVDGPWMPLGEGWVFLQKEAIDSWPGLYHDRLSGACVHVEFALTSIVSPLSESTEPPPSDYPGVPFHLSVEQYGGCVSGRTIRASFFPEEDAAPRAVNLSARTCGNQQYERFRDFLFGAQPHLATNPDLGSLHTKAELQAVPLGRSYSDIKRDFGATSGVECHPDGSFTAFWTDDSRPQFLDWAFRFAQDQNLISKELRQ